MVSVIWLRWLQVRPRADSVAAEPCPDEVEVDASRAPDPIWNIYCIGRWCMGLAYIPFVSWRDIRELWGWWFGEGRDYHHLSTWRRLQLFPIAVWCQFICDEDS